VRVPRARPITRSLGTAWSPSWSALPPSAACPKSSRWIRGRSSPRRRWTSGRPPAASSLPSVVPARRRTPPSARRRAAASARHVSTRRGSCHGKTPEIAWKRREEKHGGGTTTTTRRVRTPRWVTRPQQPTPLLGLYSKQAEKSAHFIGGPTSGGISGGVSVTFRVDQFQGAGQFAPRTCVAALQPMKGPTDVAR
jgi:hypothetical protein